MFTDDMVFTEQLLSGVTSSPVSIRDLQNVIMTSSSHQGPSAFAPEAPQPMRPLISIQHSLDIPVFLIKRHRSLTVAVLITFGSIVNSPKALKRLRDKASQ
jgi:hypothetical protein